MTPFFCLFWLRIGLGCCWVLSCLVTFEPSSTLVPQSLQTTMDSIPDIFELVVNGDELPFHVAKCASGYGAKHNGWATTDEQEFYADMLPVSIILL